MTELILQMSEVVQSSRIEIYMILFSSFILSSILILGDNND